MNDDIYDDDDDVDNKDQMVYAQTRKFSRKQVCQNPQRLGDKNGLANPDQKNRLEQKETNLSASRLKY